MGQLVRTEPIRGEHGRIGAVRDRAGERYADDDFDQGEPEAALAQVPGMEFGPSERAQRLAQGVVGRLGEVADRWTVVQVEPADGLAAGKVGG